MTSQGFGIASRILLAAMLLCAAPWVMAAQKPMADLVLTNGRVITVDAKDRVVQAVAVGGGKILAVGTDAEVLKFAGPATRRIDLKGRAATPGLLDAHAHFASGAAARHVLNLSYPAGRDIAAVRDSVAARVKAARPGAWVEGLGWDEGKLADRRMLTVRDLDPVSAGHPLWLEHTTGHYGVANSQALKLAGIGRDTKDPPGGTIDRFPDGTPTGVLKEAAQDLLIKLIPPGSPAELESGLAAMARDFNAEGMTGLKEPGIDDATWNAYSNVLKRGQLPVRVFALWFGGNTEASVQQVLDRHAAITKPYQSTGDDHLIAGGVKLYMDGSGAARTAWMSSPWNKNLREVDGTNAGYPARDPDLARRQILMVHNAGLHVSVHAVGDKAIDWVMDSYAEAFRQKPTKGLRHGIIHAVVPSEHALQLMADYQKKYDAAYPEPSATFMWWIGDNYAPNFGAERSLRVNPFQTFLKRGIIWANGSDFVVTPFPARYGIWSAVTRETLLGTWGKTPFGMAESIGVHDALRAVTIWPAHQMFMEKKIGSLEVGKYADIAVWDRDPYSVKAAELKDMRCDLTVFDGKVVFERRP
jgi:predicted amidohydrolase YtcJ